MRLIELRLKNLNSLKGEWLIDFSDDAFVNEGIFAITGQTGAGKTTILDAICLALYGETPRINSISKATNEVMTRQTGECFAEVVIELDGAKYRCRWGQRRAYGKADGKLQDATHEVAKINPNQNNDADKGDEILEDKLSRTKDKIVELTHMDFQQFTRSILLAQGSFSAFLKAKADERADILEKITGTAIYAKISQQTHEKKRQEEDELNRLKTKLEGLNLLSLDEEQQLQDKVTDYNTTLVTKRKQLQSLQAKIKWLDDSDNLQKIVQQQKLELDSATQALTSFSEDAKQLDNANKALELESPYSQLKLLRNQLHNITTDKHELEINIPTLKNDVIASQQQLTKVQKTAQEASQALEKALPIFSETRKLDAQIAQHRHDLSQQNQRKQTLSSQVANLQKQINEHLHSQNQKQTELENITDYLTEHTMHANLASEIEIFDHSCTQLKKYLLDNCQQHQTLVAQNETLATLTQQLEKHTQTQRENNLHIAGKNKQLAEIQSKLYDLFKGQSFTNVREQQEQIEEASVNLNTLSQSILQIQSTLRQIEQNNAVLPTLIDKKKTLINGLQEQENSLLHLKEKQQTTAEKLTLLEQVAKLEDYIELLETGKPCPLCGATEHPYIDDNNHPLHNHDIAHANSNSQVDSEDEVHNHSVNNSAIQTATPSATNTSPIAQARNTLNALNIQVSEFEKNINQKYIQNATVNQEIQHLLAQHKQSMLQVQNVTLDALTQLKKIKDITDSNSNTNSGNKLLSDLQLNPQLSQKFNQQCHKLFNNILDSLNAVIIEANFKLAESSSDSKPDLNSSQPSNSQPNSFDVDNIESNTTKLLTICQSVDSTIANISNTITSLNDVTHNAKQAIDATRQSIKRAINEYEQTQHNIASINEELKTLEQNQQYINNQISDCNTQIKLAEQILDSTNNQIAKNFAEMQQLMVAINQLSANYYNDLQSSLQPNSKHSSEHSSVNPANHLDTSITDNSINNTVSTNDTINELNHCISQKNILDEVATNNALEALRTNRRMLKSLQLIYTSQLESQQNLSVNISALTTQIAANRERLAHVETELASVVEAYNKTNTAIKELNTKRTELFADKDVDDEDKRLREALDYAKNNLANARENKITTEQKLAQLQHNFDKLTASAKQVTNELEVQQKHFTTLLQESGFIDETVFVQALLPKEQRQALTNKKLQLNQALQVAKSALATSQQKLAQLMENPITDVPKEDIVQQCQHTQTEVDTLIEQIGAINQQLASNNTRKSTQQTQLDAIKTQSDKLKIWNYLHKLIGSADGKKFRTFAQGLTFDIMVSNANTKLQKMSDRYLLIRDDDNPLELNVIDNYQGGEIRSTKNLSGGEGFIISLALALGLSNMASHNIRVDSLFLDEGFGTLDEDSLDIALDTLTSLQQEGKLIGVISHVQALKERIFTQIKVEKISGGYSEIKGVGCYKIAD